MTATVLQPGELTVIERALRAWPQLPDTPAVSTPAARLLNAARAAAVDAGAVGASDLAVLLRHVLRAEHERSGREAYLTVPLAPPWPSGEQWEAFAMSATADGAQQAVIAAAWSPAWLGAGERDPAADAFRGETEPPLGIPEPCPADPFVVEATGGRRTECRSRAQREAIRALQSAPPGATVVANLPTGSGKSLVGYLPALLARHGTTVVVVPTTALAIDQERAFLEEVQQRGDRDAFPRELAYHSELDDEVRARVKARIADGTQRIVFTSPESLLRSLVHAVHVAAGGRALQGLVVDEAHVVSQWGAQFRPAFQQLAGLRRELLSVAAAAGGAFPTLLLSATLTEDSLLTLEHLFGRPGPFELIASVALRHEPSYWLASCTQEADRERRVLECLRHLPRPLVLYATTVRDARRWHGLIAAAGIRRAMVVLGETDAEDRRTAIERLRDGTLDVVVATSAFGLGVDQEDVRAVLHACVPETIDRYYQEVGRGGRDRRPSVTVLVEGPRDREVAAQLAGRRLISLRRGFERWQAMRVAAETVADRTLRLPLRVSPPGILGDNDENRAWNVRTLQLMDRAGLISLEAEPPPRRAPDETEEAWEERASRAFDDHATHAVVRIRHGELANPAVWDREVGAVRRTAHTSDSLTHERMLRALEPDAAICELIAESYRIEGPVSGVAGEQLPTALLPSCGGCPGCRVAGRPPRRYPPTAPPPPRAGAHAWSAQLRPLFAGHTALVVLYDEQAADWRLEALRALQSLARHGMWCLWADASLRGHERVATLHRNAPGGAVFLLDRWQPFTAPALPTALAFAPGAAIPAVALAEDGPPRVVLAAADARDPRHATALVRDYHGVCPTTSELRLHL